MAYHCSLGDCGVPSTNGTKVLVDSMVGAAVLINVTRSLFPAMRPRVIRSTVLPNDHPADIPAGPSNRHSSDPDMKEKALAAGADVFLAKPFDL
jgi:hypothetical protein